MKKDNNIYNIDEVIDAIEKHMAFLVYTQEKTKELIPFGSSLQGVIQEMNKTAIEIRAEKREKGKTHMVIEGFQDFIFLKRKN